MPGFRVAMPAATSSFLHLLGLLGVENSEWSDYDWQEVLGNRSKMVDHVCGQAGTAKLETLFLRHWVE